METLAHSITEQQKLRFLDTFAGIGGFALPLTELGHECIGFSEIDKYASAIYARHFPSHHPYGDITKLDAATLPDFDLLVGGFPCQAFSVAGKRLGFADTRGTLFFDLARILQAKKPRHFVFENVKGLLSHESGQTFRTIVSTLAQLGYDVQWQVLNSKDFGVPQNRERVFIVGHLGGTPRPKVFPLGDCGEQATEARDEQSLCSGTLSTKNQSPQCNFDGSTVLVLQRERGNNPGSVNRSSVAPTVNSGFGDGNLAVMQTIATLGEKREDGRYRPRERVLAPGLARAVTTFETQMPWYETRPPQGARLQERDGIFPTLSANPAGGTKIEPLRDINGIRRLTPVECERLQGFPDNWTAGVSDTQRYKCLGNAVTVNVVREIVKRLK